MRTADFFAAELLLEHGAWSMDHGAWSMACDVSMVHGLCLYLCGCPDARTCPVSRHIQWDMSWGGGQISRNILRKMPCRLGERNFQKYPLSGGWSPIRHPKSETQAPVSMI